ncbi:cold-shock protein [Jannaschia sp. M317]|uniref:cold-shock protein n=1 Tax=Jannaschia sp. M317 TaxID=2867011 RepID=UPI0021A6A58B|nr:cold shock domain-containing protein [Jannaschia sp. M317]
MSSATDQDAVGTGTQGEVVSGRVKWFDAARGFGFIVSDGADRDVLLHVNVLRNFGQSSVADGSEISLRIQASDRGLQAVEILSITPPEPEEIAYVGNDVPEYLQPYSQDLPFLPARVKWFDKSKGFGFANAFGHDSDIFIHIEVLRRFGLADLAPGEAICLRAIDGARGELAVEVRRWEYYMV